MAHCTSLHVDPVLVMSACRILVGRCSLAERLGSRLYGTSRPRVCGTVIHRLWVRERGDRTGFRHARAQELVLVSKLQTRIFRFAIAVRIELVWNNPYHGARGGVRRCRFIPLGMGAPAGLVGFSLADVLPHAFQRKGLAMLLLRAEDAKFGCRALAMLFHLRP